MITPRLSTVLFEITLYLPLHLENPSKSDDLLCLATEKGTEGGASDIPGTRVLAAYYVS